MELKNWFFAVIAITALVACAGSGDGEGADTGYSGKESAATVNEENKDDIAIASSVGAKQAIEASAAPGRALVPRVRSVEPVLEHHILALNDFFGEAKGRGYVDLSSSVCEAGGSAGYTYDENNTTGYGTFSITYNNCRYSYGGETAAIDGFATYTNNEDGSLRYEYDITVSYGSESYKITAIYECDAEFNCSYSDEFSYSGTSYRVSNFSVSGSASSGYDVEAKVYHEDYGYITIEGTDLISCSEGGFSSGTIVVTDSTSANVLTITFVSCTEMTIVYNNVSSTVTW